MNDTLDGTPVVIGTNPGEVTLTGVTVPTELTLNPDGTITVEPNTPSGTYTVVYEICEVGAVPANCDQATATVVVLNPIDAVNDTNPVAVNGYEGGIAIPSVLTNDTLDSVAISLSQATITLVGVLPTGITFNTATGEVGVNSGTPAGVYTFVYQICEVGANPANCDTATVTVNVSAPPISAEDDDLTSSPINGYDGGIPGNIFDNNGSGEDTLNLLPVLEVEVNVTITNDGGLTGVTIDNDGTINVPAGTPAGTYFVTYNMCDVLNPTNCDSAIITIVVTAAPIDAVNDDYTNEPINADNGGTFPILNNDTLNNDPINIAEVTYALLDDGGLSGVTINSNGTVTVPAGTPVGTYIVTYTVCEILNPNNCDSATVTIVVKDPCDFDDSPSSCDIIVYNTITNNGDADNSEFKLEGIERFPNNSVEIYNRWGILVYETKGYNNTTRVFKGYSDGRSTIQQDSGLPEGTYFYVLKYTKTSGVNKEKTGYLYINRK